MPKHYKDMMDEIINKIDEDSNTIYKVKKDGKIVFTGKYNQVLTYRKNHGGEIVTENAPTSADIDRLKKQGLKPKTEDAPANAVAHGGVDMNPTGKKRVMGTLKRKVQESDDNNNVVLKGVYKVLNKLEEKIDEISGVVKEEIKIETPKRKKTIKEKARV